MQPKDFQIAIKKLPVMRFRLVEIETSFPMRFVFCTEIKSLSTIKNI